MFRKRKDDETTTPVGDPPEEDMSAPPLKPFSRKGSHTPALPATNGNGHFRAEPARRTIDIPSHPNRRLDRPRAATGSAEDRKLTVGREIRLSGEITCCDKLVVEGHVEAALSDARVIEVTRTGFFKGNAQVEEADISGRYDGELIVRDKLVVRATGRVSGSVRYGRIIIESGGEISGDMRTLTESDMLAAEDHDSGPVDDDIPSTGSGLRITDIDETDPS